MLGLGIGFEVAPRPPEIRRDEGANFTFISIVCRRWLRSLRIKLYNHSRRFMTVPIGIDESSGGFREENVYGVKPLQLASAPWLPEEVSGAVLAALETIETRFWQDTRLRSAQGFLVEHFMCAEPYYNSDLIQQIALQCEFPNKSDHPALLIDYEQPQLRRSLIGYYETQPIDPELLREAYPKLYLLSKKMSGEKFSSCCVSSGG